MEFDFIMIAPLVLSHCSASLPLDMEYLFFFFGGFQCPPVDGCSASCSFGALTGGDERMSFYSTIMNRKLKPQLLF